MKSKRVKNIDDVKVIYCYDENENAIHYTKTQKGIMYYCIDCGSELVCKHGEIYIKHLAHKNAKNCGGTGESIFHKHWKENLFKPGMYINIANRISEPVNIEILDVLNEVSLCKRYKKNWKKDIVVDVLLVTEQGDIAVEINYKNSKNWNRLKPFYDELNLLRVYEVTVDKYINTKLKWFCLGEDEEVLEQSKRERAIREAEDKRKKQLKQERKLERERIKEEVERAEHEEILKNISEGNYIDIDIFYNFKNPLTKTSEGEYTMSCLHEKYNGDFERIKVKFIPSQLRITDKRLLKDFAITKGINTCMMTIRKQVDQDGSNLVMSLGYVNAASYNNRLYARLCSIA